MNWIGIIKSKTSENYKLVINDWLISGTDCFIRENGLPDREIWSCYPVRLLESQQVRESPLGILKDEEDRVKGFVLSIWMRKDLINTDISLKLTKNNSARITKVDILTLSHTSIPLTTNINDLGECELPDFIGLSLEPYCFRVEMEGLLSDICEQTAEIRGRSMICHSWPELEEMEDIETLIVTDTCPYYYQHGKMTPKLSLSQELEEDKLFSQIEICYLDCGIYGFPINYRIHDLKIEVKDHNFNSVGSIQDLKIKGIFSGTKHKLLISNRDLIELPDFNTHVGDRLNIKFDSSQYYINLSFNQSKI